MIDNVLFNVENIILSSSIINFMGPLKLHSYHGFIQDFL